MLYTEFVDKFVHEVAFLTEFYEPFPGLKREYTYQLHSAMGTSQFTIVCFSKSLKLAWQFRLCVLCQCAFHLLVGVGGDLTILRLNLKKEHELQTSTLLLPLAD